MKTATNGMPTGTVAISTSPVDARRPAITVATAQGTLVAYPTGPDQDAPSGIAIDLATPDGCAQVAVAQVDAGGALRAIAWVDDDGDEDDGPDVYSPGDEPQVGIGSLANELSAMQSLAPMGNM